MMDAVIVIRTDVFKTSFINTIRVSEYKILAKVISRRQSMSPEGKGLTLLFGIFLLAPLFCSVKICVNILNGSSSRENLSSRF